MRALLFDLDHTLYSRAGTYRAMAPHMKAFFSLPGDCETLARLLYEADDQGFYDEQWQFVGSRGMLGRLGEVAAFPAAEEFLAYIEEYLPYFCRPYPFTHPVLWQLRAAGFPMGLVTNGKHAMQQTKLKVLGIEPYFDYLLCAGDEGRLKPDPQVFLQAAAALGTAPGETLFIGDNPLDDISGAKAAGLQAAWVRRRGEYPAGFAAPDHVLESIADLPALLGLLTGAPD